MSNPFDHLIRILREIVIAVPPPTRALDPKQLLVLDRNIVENLLQVTGLRKNVVMYLGNEGRHMYVVHREAGGQLHLRAAIINRSAMPSFSAIPYKTAEANYRWTKACPGQFTIEREDSMLRQRGNIVAD